MKWVLLIILTSGYGPHKPAEVELHDFQSEKGCKRAAARIKMELGASRTALCIHDRYKYGNIIP